MTRHFGFSVIAPIYVFLPVLYCHGSSDGLPPGLLTFQAICLIPDFQRVEDMNH